MRKNNFAIRSIFTLEKFFTFLFCVVISYVIVLVLNVPSQSVSENDLPKLNQNEDFENSILNESKQISFQEFFPDVSANFRNK